MYHDELKQLMDDYAHLIYKLTKSFPKEELYGLTSQLRRAGLSIVLNYIEGFARFRSKVYQNFLEISYGSLKESKYLLEFASKENYINIEDYQKANIMADRIGAMLWSIFKKP